MITLFKKDSEKADFVTSFKNPFQSDRIETITFEIENYSWRNGVRFNARVSFRNGDTSGWHRIEADSFNELLDKTKTFVDSL